MHVKSQETQMLVKYYVWTGDYDLYYEHSMDEDDLLSHPVPSRDIDDRTIKTRPFNTEAEAIKFANEYLAKRRDDNNEDQVDPWLAFIEIKKCTVEVIHKIK